MNFAKKLFTLLLLVPSLALAAANDMVFMQRNPTDTGAFVRILPPPAPGVDGFFRYNSTTLLPELIPLGNRLSINPSTSALDAASGDVAYPTSRAVSLATAYQCMDATKPCVFTLTLTSTASLSLTAGTANTADVLVGNSSAVASGTGTIIAKYSNTISGTLVVGLGINTNANSTYSVFMPIGGYIAVRQTGGTISIVSAFDQSIS